MRWCFVLVASFVATAALAAPDACKSAKATIEKDAFSGAEIVTVQGGSGANVDYPMWPGWIMTSTDGVVRLKGRAVLQGAVGLTLDAGWTMEAKLADDTDLTLTLEAPVTFAESVQKYVTLGYGDLAFVLDKATVDRLATTPIRAMRATFQPGAPATFAFPDKGQAAFTKMMACMALKAKPSSAE